MNALLWILTFAFLALNVLEIETAPPVSQKKAEKESEKVVKKICREQAIEDKLRKIGYQPGSVLEEFKRIWLKITQRRDNETYGRAIQAAAYYEAQLDSKNLALQIRDEIITDLAVQSILQTIHLNEAKRNNEVLTKHNAELISDLVAANQLNGRLVTKNKNLTAQNKDLIKAVTILVLYVDYLERELALISARRDELEKHVASLKEQLQSAMHNIELKDQQISSLEDKITKLNGDLERISAEKTALNEKYSVALNDIKNLNEKVTTLTGEKATAQGKADASEKEAKDLTGRLATAEANLKSVNDKVDELKANLAKVEKEAAVSKTQHEAAATSWEKEKQKLTGEKEILQLKLSTAEAKSAELSGKLEGLNKLLQEREVIVAELKKDIAGATEDKKNLEKSLAQVEAELTILKAAKEKLSNEYVSQKTKLEGLNVEVAKLEASGKADSQAKVKAETQNAADAVRLVEYQNQISTLQQKQAELSVKLETLNQQIRDVENARAKSEADHKEVLNGVQNKLDLAVERNTILERQLESLTRESSDAKTRVAVLETIEKNLSEQNKKELEKNAALEKSKGEVAATNAGLNAQLQGLNKSLGGFEKELELLHKEFQTLQSSQASTQKVNSDLTQQNGQLEKRIGDLNAEYSQIKDQLAKADASISKLNLEKAELGRLGKHWKDNAIKYKTLNEKQKRENEVEAAKLVSQVGKKSKLLAELKKDNSTLRKTLEDEKLTNEQKIAALEEFHNKNMEDFGNEVLEATNNSDNWEVIPSSYGEVLRSLVPWGKGAKDKKMDPKKLRDSIQSIYKRFDEESKPKDKANTDNFSAFALVGDDLKAILSEMENLTRFFVFPVSA